MSALAGKVWHAVFEMGSNVPSAIFRNEEEAAAWLFHGCGASAHVAYLVEIEVDGIVWRLAGPPRSRAELSAAGQGVCA